MSNLLALPFKKSYFLDVKEPTRRYLEEHTSFHPDAFKADLNEWQELRQATVDIGVRVGDIAKLINYHTQLLSILNKLPPDIGLEVSYATVFAPNGLPISLRHLGYERCSILFNLAALYSQLATAEDRSNIEGIKRAIGYYQNAAGTLNYLRLHVLEDIKFSAQDEDNPPDLLQSFIYGMEWLMLAQAQECFWQKARLDNFKNSLIAKLASSSAGTYKLALTHIRDANPPIKHLLPPDWIPYIDAKQHHFDAVAYFRKSMEESERSNYGLEIAYLREAKTEVQKAYDVARRGRVMPPVQQDIKSLLDAVGGELTRAERDNDFIYHKDVPTASGLPSIPHAAIAQINVPSALLAPQKHEDTILGDLLGWGAQEAINIYNDRKKTFIKDQIIDASKELRDKADKVLRVHNLPASLEALERPIGLPPSLLKKAGEVRRENGPTKIESWFEDLQRQARHVNKILDEALDILDSEATEDEIARKSGDLSRPPSHDANTELIEKERRYRQIIRQANQSDESVHRKWEEWEENIMDLLISESELEALVPASTASKRKTAEAALTQRYARNLRVLLEKLDTVHSDRALIVRRAEHLADSDDIRGRIQQAASKIRDVTEIQPAKFENILDEELEKYDKFCELMRDNEQIQEDILAAIEADNEKFLSSRKEDPSIKEREQALQALDLAYQMYREISGNLEEGIRFYNDLAGLLMQYKVSCKLWCNHRHEELHSLQATRSFATASLKESYPKKEEKVEEEKETPEDDLEIIPSPPKKALSEKAKGKLPALPSINSAEWGFEEISLPPGPLPQTPRVQQKKRVAM